MSELDAARPEILGRILLLQGSLQAAPDERRLLEMTAHALADLPGVADCRATLGERTARASRRADGADHGAPRRFALQTVRRDYGAIELDVNDEAAFAPYRALVANTANLIALHVESARAAAELRAVNRELEQRARARAAELQENAVRMELVLHGADLGTWDWNVATGEVTFNRRWAAMLGHDLDEIPPRIDSWERLVHPDDMPAVRSELAAHLEGRAPRYETEHRMRHSSGRWIWVLDKGRVIERDADGRPLRACGTHLDITARKEAEQASQRSAERLRLAQHLTGVGTWEWVIATDEVHWSDEMLAMWGMPPEEFRGTLDEVAARIHPDDRDRWRKDVRACLEEGREHNLEYRVVRPGGEERWVEVIGDVERDDQGRAVRMLGVALDVTARRHTLEEQRLAAERFRSLMEHTSEGFYLFETDAPIPVDLPVDEQIRRLYDGVLVECNDAQARMYGHERARDIIGASLVELHGTTDDPDNLAFLRAWIEAGYRSEGGLTAEIDREGNEVWFANNVVGVVEDGRLARVWGTQTDVTERVRAEDARRETARLHEQVVSAAQEGIVVYDHELRCVTWNPFMERLTGVAAQDVIGRRALEELPRLRTPEVDALLERALAGETVRSDDLPLPGRDGEPAGWYVATVTPRREPDGTISGVVATFHDITARRRSEEERESLQTQLNQAQKVEAIGRLAGGIAHDLNNLLSPVLGYGEMLQEDIAPHDGRREFVDAIVTAGGRARDMVRQLLAFSRKQTLEFQPVDLDTVVASFRGLLRRTVREDIELVVGPGGKAPTVLGDVGQIEQMILNLAVNAADAMPDGGRLTIETGVVELDEDYAAARSGVRPGRYAMLAISDTGVGMDAETRAQVFEPFFSTKGERGTGLGLATVYGSVKQHGGNIWVYSEPGQGTTFKIYLPVADRRGPVERTAPAAGAAARGSETILVVEDDEHVRHLAHQSLSRLGYEVLVAGDAAGAESLLAGREGPLHLLLTDVVLPGLNGKELYRRLAADHEGLRVLFMSGYTDDVIAHRGVLHEGVRFIQKPFSLRALAAKVREALDAD